jgi:hypothetical protein
VSTKERPPQQGSLAFAELVLDRQRRWLKNRTALSTEIEELQQGAESETRQLLGSAAYDDLLALRSSVAKRLEEQQVQGSATPEGRRAREELTGRVKQEMRGFFEGLGTDPDQLRQIRRKYQAQTRSAIGKATNFDAEAAPALRTPETAPDPCKSPGWVWLYPPYLWSNGGSWHTYWGTGGRVPRIPPTRHSESEITGEVGCYTYLGAEDEKVWAEIQSELWAWFHIPTTGLVEAWIFLQAADTPWSGFLVDEGWFTDANITQRSQAFLQVLNLQGGTHYQTLLDYHRGDDEGSWSGEVAAPGSFVYVHLFSAEVHQAGSQLLLSFGLEDYTLLDLDDSWVNCRQTSRWFVHHVALRSTGG